MNAPKPTMNSKLCTDRLWPARARVGTQAWPLGEKGPAVRPGPRGPQPASEVRGHQHREGEGDVAACAQEPFCKSETVPVLGGLGMKPLRSGPGELSEGWTSVPRSPTTRGGQCAGDSPPPPPASSRVPILGSQEQTTSSQIFLSPGLSDPLPSCPPSLPGPSSACGLPLTVASLLPWTR